MPISIEAEMDLGMDVLMDSPMDSPVDSGLDSVMDFGMDSALDLGLDFGRISAGFRQDFLAKFSSHRVLFWYGKNPGRRRQKTQTPFLSKSRAPEGEKSMRLRAPRGELRWVDGSRSGVWKVEPRPMGFSVKALRSLYKLWL